MTTDATPQESPVPPLWSNHRIGSLSTKFRKKPPFWFTASSVIDAARMVRDDYEAERQRLAARIAALEAQLANARKWLPDSALEDEDE
jgi:hypothetical protein